MLKLILTCSSVIALAVGFILCTATVTQSHPYQTNTPNTYRNGGGYYSNGVQPRYYAPHYQRQMPSTFTPDYLRQINTPSLYGNMVMPTRNQLNGGSSYDQRGYSTGHSYHRGWGQQW